MQHRFYQLSKTPVEVIEGVVVANPFQREESVVGCENCDMGLDEALSNPNCMGVPLERLLED